MLDAAGGGGYGGTDWFSFDVTWMWGRISDQKTDAHDEVSLGWKRTAELTSTHLGRVQLYRDNLAAAWPPEKSKASAAYVAQLDDLIASLTETQAAASANYTAFSSVASTLSIARSKLEPIYREYVANQTSIAQWQAKKDAAANTTTTPSSSSTPTPSPSPQASPVPTSPPVSADHQEQLNNQARAIMFDLSSTIISGQTELQKPKPYEPAWQTVEESPKSGGDGTSGPVVPPVIPMPAPASGGSTSSSHVSTSFPTTAAPSPATTVPTGGTGGVGPILTGIQPSPPPTITPPPIGGLPSPPPISSPLPGVITPPGLTPGLGGGFGPGSKLPGGGLKPGTGTGRMTAMPSGGVIGAKPGSGMIGQMPSGSRVPGSGSAGRVNPVGGVIGSQAETAGRPGGRPGAGAGGMNGQHGSMVGQQGRGRGRRGEGETSTHWDPDNPWATDEGVDPVVLPPSEPGPIDPGPAIGYTG
jgi:hypothetical protein